MAKKKRLHVNALILLGILAVAGLLIVTLPVLLKPKPLVPPESPEVAAKRLGPENAASVLAEASAQLPKAPGFLMVPSNDNPKQTEKYVPKPGSLGRLLGIARPDDDPEFVAYLQGCGLAMAKMREALKRPYYLHPVDWSKASSAEERERLGSKLNGVYPLSAMVAAQGVLAARAGDGANALNGALDLIRLALLIHDEWWGSGLPISRRACAYEMVHGSTDAALEAAAAQLQRFRGELKPPVARLTFVLREVDSGEFTYAGETREFFVKQFYRDTLSAVLRRRLHDWIIGHRDEIFAIVARPMPEICDWTQKASAELRQRLKGDDRFAQSVYGVGVSAAETRLLVEGTLLVVALERYRRAEGGYPETLNALSPKYVDSVPQDPFSGEPLIYKRADADYQLYSVGSNRKDDGGGTIPEGRTRPKGVDILIHWPGGIQN